MKIKDTLQRDPATQPLINQGQARLSDGSSPQELEELRGELATFVCEGQYADGIQTIIKSYLDNLSRTNQRAAWVSGFFGSGKSHVLKMLTHLWMDTKFPDGSTARSIVPHMPDDLRELLRELDTAGRRAGGLLAAAGSLPSGTTDHVRLTILGIIFKACGLPTLYPQARFCLWLHQQGIFERVKMSVEAAGKDFQRELNNLYVSSAIAKALLEAEPRFAESEAKAKQLLAQQYPGSKSDITDAEFLQFTKEALSLKGDQDRRPCTLIVLDEVQQYIGESNDRSVAVTNAAEIVSKQLDSQVMVVGAGQSALTDVPLLHKLMDRFTIRVTLSDAEVEQVTRKVLLQKKPAALQSIRHVLEQHAGEVARQLQGTRIGETLDDKTVIVDDYPLLPVRRRFWEQCFRQIDAAGTHSQLRSQLRIIHDAVAKISDRPLGTVVPADELYEALAPEMVNTGVLLREINEKIIKIGGSHGPLARRICGLVFLIGKLKRDGDADTGVRANKEHIADLLVSDLTADNGKLRADVESTLQTLVDDGALMRVGDEYLLQTRIGAEWDREFRNRQTKLGADDATLQIKREQLLYGKVETVVRGIRLTQGGAKEPRQLAISRESSLPAADGASIPLWLQDGWSASEKQVLEAVRGVGPSSPIVAVFLPRQSAEDLRRLLIEVEAARQTLDAKGNPNTAEGQEARSSMESRRNKAASELDRLLGEIAANAKVFQGGGNELLNPQLEERIRTAAEDALVRLFPQFKDADSKAWEAVIKRAREGADHPFQPTGYAGATEKHPVCLQVNTTIGAGKSGAEVRKVLRASPYGWPQDAIDAALIALHRLQHISATLNGTAVPLGQLDQNKISKAEFRVEHSTLSVQDRLTVRKLITRLVACKNGEEGAKAPEFLAALVALGKSAGGNAPLPAAPSTAGIEDLQHLVGNDQLAGLRDQAAALEKFIEDWTATKGLVDKRLPAWELVQRMVKHARGLPAAAEPVAQAQAIVDGRLLLEPMDPVAPLRGALAGALRTAVTDAEEAVRKTCSEGLKNLAGNDLWSKVPAADQESILRTVGLVTPAVPALGSDDALLTHLERRSLAVIQSERDAMAGRVGRALEMAAKLLEPKVQPVPIERATLHSPAEVDAWLERQRKRLLEAVGAGPVLIS